MTPYHPEGNVVIERFNGTLISMLSILNEVQNQECSKQVQYLAHAYNCTQHDATGFQPFYLMFMRHP